MYWLSKLSGDLPPVSLPTRRLDGSLENERGALDMPIPVDVAERLAAIANSSDSAMLVLFMSALAVWFSRSNASDDVLIATVTPRQAGVKDKIVFCRTQLADDLAMKEVWQKMKQTVLEGFRYSDLSFGVLYQKLLANRQVESLDVFRVACYYDELQNRSNFLQQFELVVALSGKAPQLKIHLEFNRDRYGDDAVERFAADLVQGLASMVADPACRKADVDLLGRGERELLARFAGEKHPWPAGKTVHELFQDQVRRTPDQPAVFCAGHSLTYRQLNDRANRLARVLRRQGVERGTIVGVMLERSLDMVVGLLAVLKAGGAYVPLDPDAPTNRVAAILDDCQAPLLITQRKVLTRHSYTSLQGIRQQRREPIVTPERPRLLDFDACGIPNRSYVDYEKYNRFIGQAMVKNRISIQASRGCPSSCIYCYEIWPNKQVARSGENIFEEIRMYYRMGIRKFDIFMLNIGKGRRLFELLIENDMTDVKLFFPNGFRGDLLTREYIDLMVRAGTVNLAVALETASPRLQKVINKNLDLDRLRENIDYFCRRYPHVIIELFTMHGIPTETREEARMTLDFIKSLKWMHFPYVNILKIYHNTGMEKLALETGISAEAIQKSENLAWHEYSDTLPFEKSFTSSYQTEFLSEYVLNRERLLHVLPHQMRLLTEAEMVEKYNSYLPTPVKSFAGLLEFLGVTREELGGVQCPDPAADETVLRGLNERIRSVFPPVPPAADAFRVLLLDLSQYFDNGSSDMLYDVVEPPLGLMYIMTHMEREFGDRVHGKILKARMDFNSMEELRALLQEFKPQLIGVRTLTYYKDFFHDALAAIRRWGITAPIVTGGPYATVDAPNILQDGNIDIVAFGEGECTFSDVVRRVMEHGGALPPDDVLRTIPGIGFMPAADKGDPALCRRLIVVDESGELPAAESGEDLPGHSGPADPAYVIFTSGSTGRPKGVVVEHRQAVHTVSWFADRYIADAGERVLQMTNYTFDPSVEQIFAPLGRGAQVWLPEKELIGDAAAFARYLQQNGITLLNFVPGTLQMLLRGARIPSLRTVISGGEKLNENVKNLLLEKGYELHNHYGPTEITVDALADRCDQGPVMLGRPIHNTVCHILDRNGRQLPVGAAGELYISGPGVARGYLNNEALTAERFLPAPDGGRMYRTGDWARWHEDGRMEYIGRMDEQVKVHGHRIELGEIAAQLRKNGKVRDCVVLARGEGDDKYLCAYVQVEGEITEMDLRAFLALELPDYMVPAHFLLMDELPRNRNGKIDRQALPDPRESGAEEKTVYTAPGSEMEILLAGIWESVLGKKPVGIHDNFFTNGGDSIKAIQIVARLNESHCKVEMKDIFQKPTIAELAPLVRRVTRTSDQSALTGEVPLLPAQWEFFDRHGENRHHFNQTVMLHAREGFDEGILRSVFRHIMEHHDALRMTFSVGDGVRQICRGTDLEADFQVFDWRGRPEAGAGLTETAAGIQAAIDLERGPLVKLALFRLDDGDRLLIVVHHLVMDGISWRILFDDIENLHRALREGRPAGLPAKTDSVRIWGERLREYTSTPAFLRAAEYWTAPERRHEMHVPLETPGENRAEDVEARTVQFGEEETAALLGPVHRAFHTEVNDLLLAALGQAVQRHWGIERVAVALEGHGREPIAPGVDVSRTIGWFTSVFPVLLETRRDGDTGRYLMEVKENLRRIPNKGIDYGILRYLVPTSAEGKLPAHPSLSFNYLGQFDSDLEGRSFTLARESTGPVQSPKSPREYTLNINGMVRGGRLSMTVAYSRRQYSAAAMERFLEHFRAALGELVRHCREQSVAMLTPADFTWKGLDIDTAVAIQRKFSGQVLDVYRLAPMQAGMLFHALYNRASAAYFEQTSYRLQGEVDAPAVQRALDELHRRYDILRTTFLFEEIDTPVQVVHAPQPAAFTFIDLAAEGRGDEGEAFVHDFRARDRNQGFDLVNGPLMRVTVIHLGGGVHEFIWSHHHILMDGWCTGILIAEFFEIYHGIRRNRPWQLPAVAPYRNYIAWLQEQDPTVSAVYWQDYLQDYEELASLPGGVRHAAAEYRGERVTVTLDKETTALLHKVASRNRVTPNILLQTVWGILLARYGGRRDVVFGSVVAGRPAVIGGVEEMVGLFINTIPVRVRFEAQEIFRDVLQAVQARALQSEDHQYFPLAEIQTAHPLKQNLLDHIVIFENYPVAEQISGSFSRSTTQEGGWRLARVESFEQTNYDFNLVVVPGERMQIRLEYNAAVFPAARVEYIGGQLRRALEQFLGDETMPVSALELLTAEEKQRILGEWNATAGDTEEAPLHELILRQAQAHPDHAAVVCGGRSMTYRELEEASARLAAGLQKRGVRRGDIVAVMLDKSVEMVAALLAVMRAGGAYLPVDPQFPQARKEFILEDSKAVAVLTDRHWRAADTGLWGKFSHLPLLCGEEWPDLPAADGPLPTVGAEDPVYIIYTSGTSGRSKGVVVPHRGVVNLALWRCRAYGMNAADVALQLFSFIWDGFGANLYSTLLSGGTMIMPTDDQRLDMEALSTLVRSHGVTNTTIIPGIYETILEGCRREDLVSLRWVALAGEKAAPTLLRRHRETLPDVRLYNEYGPTETSIGAVAHVEYSTERNPAVIGRPMTNVRVYILDECGRLQPPEIPGELCIAGRGVALGYLGNPELTAARFVPDPFAEGRMYRSGDSARWLPNGEIEFLGRLDQQVKIRGIRVEPGEVEDRLTAHPSVREAAVLALRDGQVPGRGPWLLWAFVAAPGTDGETLREYLRRELPDYLVPGRIVMLDTIPRTAVGKVDLRTLESIAAAARQVRTYIAPESVLEEQIAAIWSSVLQLDNVGVEDNFFEIGGNSLNIIQVNSRLKKVLQRPLAVVTQFEYPTVRQLAAYLGRDEEAAAVHETELNQFDSAQNEQFAVLQSTLDILKGVQDE